MGIKHCVKSVQIRYFFWSVFSRTRTEYGEIRSISQYSVPIRENTDQKKLRIRNISTQWNFVDFSENLHFKLEFELDIFSDIFYLEYYNKRN